MVNKGTQKKIGIILSYLSIGITVLTGLIYTPIMLRLLGQSEYGLYQMVSSVVSYLSLLGLGFSSSYVRFYSRYKNKNDEIEIERLNGMFLCIFLCISLVCLICGFIMLSNIKLIFGDGLTDAEYSTAGKLFIILIFSMAITFPRSLFSSIITAHENFIVLRVVELVQNILNPFIALPLLLAGCGSIGMVVATAILNYLTFFLYCLYCIKRLHTRFIFKGFKFSLFKEMSSFTVFIFLNQIIDQINWSVDKFLIGRIINTSAVAIYSLGSTLNSMYIQFSTSVSSVFVPQINFLVEKGNSGEEINVLFCKVGRMQFAILSLVLTGFILFGKAFISFWGGEGYEDSYYVALLLLIPETIPLIQNIGIEIQRAMNKHRIRSIVYLIIAILNVIITIPLINQFGVVGAASGTAVAIIFGNILFMNWYYNRYIGIDIFQFWKKIIRMCPAIALSYILGHILTHILNIYRLTYLIVGIIIYILIYCIAIFSFGLNKSERNSIIVFLNRRRNIT